MKESKKEIVIIKTVEDIIREVIKKSPKLDMSREDLKRNKLYYQTGGDPDRRNQI